MANAQPGLPLESRHRPGVPRATYELEWDAGVATWPNSTRTRLGMDGWDDIPPTALVELRNGLRAIGIEAKLTKEIKTKQTVDEAPQKSGSFWVDQ